MRRTDPRSATWTSGRDRSACPDLEMLSAYIDGKLDEVSRGQIESHASRCEECYYLLRETSLTLPILDESDGRSWSWHWLAALAAALVLGLGLTAGWMEIRSRTNPVGSLVREVGERRLFEARLSGGFHYGPLVGSSRSGDIQASGMWKLVGAAGEIREKANANPTTENLRALASAHLLLGEVSEAIRILDDVVQESPRDATARSDLAAAYLTRAERENRADDWPMALESTEIALELEPGLKEALFNKALALEALHLSEQAIAAWELYESSFPDDEWLPAVREHLAELRQSGRQTSPPGASLQEARLEVEENLLGRWARSVSSGHESEAKDLLREAQVLAERYRSATNDTLLLDAMGPLSVPRPPEDLVAGHRFYAEGLDASKTDSWTKAWTAFASAASRLRSGHSPFYRWAMVQKGICEYYLERHDAALQSLDEALADAPGTYRALRARGLWIEGLIRFAEEQPYNALLLHRESLDLFKALGESEHAFMVQSLFGNDLWALGRRLEAWNEWIPSLAAGTQSLPPRRAYLLYWGIARASESTMPRVTLALTRQMVAAIRRTGADGDKGVVAAALTHLASISPTPQRTEEASRHLAEAESLIAGTPYEMRVLLEADIDKVRGRILAETDPEEAIRSLSSALAFYERSKERILMSNLLSQRADLWNHTGHAKEALQDAEAGLEHIRVIADHLPVGSERLRLATDADRLATQLIGGLVRAGLPQEGLFALEVTRALFHGGPDASHPLNAGRAERSLSRALPQGVLVVEFVLLGDDVASWTLTRDVDRFDLLHGSDCDSKRSHELGAWESWRRSSPRLAADCYRGLFGHLADELRRNPYVIVVPDGSLYDVPFSSLPTESGRGFGEDHVVSVAPSLFHVVRSPTPPSKKTPELVVVLGETGPALSQLGLPLLPGADTEAKAVEALYLGRYKEIRGRSALLDEIGGADVVHFAGHALQNDAAPELEALVLQGTDGAPELLYAHEIERLRLRPGVVVVLAGCRTGADASRGRTVAPGLVQAFLDAGVSTVIAAAREVDDRVSATFMPVLHQELVSGVAADRALQLDVSNA